MWKTLGHSYEEKPKIYMRDIGFILTMNIGWLKNIEDSKEHVPLCYEMVVL